MFKVIIAKLGKPHVHPREPIYPRNRSKYSEVPKEADSNERNEQGAEEVLKSKSVRVMITIEEREVSLMTRVEKPLT